MVKLIGYDFEIHYKPDTENHSPDALSMVADEVLMTAISVPKILDWVVIKEEVSRDPKEDK